MTPDIRRMFQSRDKEDVDSEGIPLTRPKFEAARPTIHFKQSSERAPGSTRNQQKEHKRAGAYKRLADATARKFESGWTLEFFAAMVSFLCLVALIIVLVYSDGKKQTSWFSTHVTLNSVIALLSTACRASIMVAVAAALSQLKWNHFAPSASPGRHRLEEIEWFDAASRSVWGSITLLFHLRIHLGILGALITISALTFDFFTQQMVVVDYRPTPMLNHTGLGKITRSELYSSGPAVLESSGTISEEPREGWSLSANASSAIYSAIIDPNSISFPQVQCSTGNCTWPEVASLAVCGECKDITKSLLRSSSGSAYSGFSNFTYSLPEWDYVSSSSVETDLNTLAEGTALDIFEVSSSEAYNNSTVGYIKKFVVVDASLRSQTHALAYTCALWWCVQSYQISVEDSVQTQIVTANYSNANQVEITDAIVGQVHDNHPYYSNLTGFSDSQVNVPAGTLFGYGAQTTMAYSDTTLFNSSVAASYAGQLLHYNDSIAPFFYQIEDWSSFVDKLALSMTNSIRETGTSKTPDSRYAGTAYQQVPYVHVRWAWLAFPVSFLVLSLAFLVVSVWDTRRRHMIVWKSRVLPILFCRVDPEVDQYFTNEKDASQSVVILDTKGIPILRKAEPVSNLG